MKDQDDRKSFIIPKTYASTEDVLISEKPHTRNVIELFADVRACALDSQFDFGQGHCQSCDTIRNPKLQKQYNHRRAQMKKDQDPIERLVFHLVPNRGVALAIAKAGLGCEQLSFKVDTYLGDPKDGIHLCRRPDVLLRASNKQQVNGFGLLICKVLLGRGYVTVPSTVNSKLVAQLHYDHHFSKTPPTPKEQRFTADSLAKSLIFCYEHRNFETVSYPSQILPIAVLWYDLPEKFLFQSPSRSRPPQQCPQKLVQRQISAPPELITRASVPPTASISSATPIDLTNLVPIETSTPTKTFRQPVFPIQQTPRFAALTIKRPLLGTRDTRVARPTETIPLSAQKPNCARSQSNLSSSETSGNKSTSVTIPHDSIVSLSDPRLANFKPTRTVFYLESKAVDHALQQQKRLKTYFHLASHSNKRTTYTVIPLIAQIEAERSLPDNSPSLCVSVTDCFHFGFQPTSNQIYIDLEKDENQSVYKEIQISDQLIEKKKKSHSKTHRLRTPNKQQVECTGEKGTPDQSPPSLSEIYTQKGRTLLENHVLPTPFHSHLTSQLLDFFSYEYRHENRPHIQRMLAELLGVLVEKYPMENQTNERQEDPTPEIEVETIEPVPSPPIDPPTSHVVIDMDLDSIGHEESGDCNERLLGHEEPSPMEKPIGQPPRSTPVSEVCSGRGEPTLSVATSSLVDAHHHQPAPLNNPSIPEAPVEVTLPQTNQRTEDEPIAKRAKVDTTAAGNDIAVSASTNVNQLHHRSEINGKSSQPTTHSHTLPVPIPQAQPCLLVPITNRPGPTRPNKKLKRASDASYSKQLRRTNQSNPLVNRQRTYFLHSSTTESSFSNNTNLVVDSTAMNYRSFQANMPPSLMGNYPLAPPLMMSNPHLSSSHFGEPNSNYPYYSDNYHAQPTSIPPLMFPPSTTNLPNSFNARPSDAIERLQLFLQNGPSNGASMPLGNYQQSSWSSVNYSSTRLPHSNIYL